MLYENRAVAFVDVLGFKNIINQTFDDTGNEIEDKTEKLHAFFEEVEREFCSEEKWSDLPDTCTRIVTHFSDSIVFSVKAEHQDGILFLLDYIHYLVITGIQYGILFRGGITYGKVVHTDKILFGPAMNKAYSLESKTAIYPRIIIDNDVIKNTFKHKGPQADNEDVIRYLNTIVSQDEDKYFYINYFSNVVNELEYPCDKQDYCERISRIIEENITVISQLPVNIESLKLKQKYTWMKRKFNQMIKEFRDDLPSYPKEEDFEGWFDLGNYWKNKKLFRL